MNTRQPASEGMESALRRRAVWLVGATAGYNIVEGVVAVWSGARVGSPALVAFGLDSGIECVAAGALLWRLRGTHDSERRERIAMKIVGVTFLALAFYVSVHGALTLVGRDAPEDSTVGIVLGLLSLVLMPLVSMAKLKVAARIGSRALRAEALETLACSYLTVALLGGLLLNSTLGWWWADPVAAFLMVPWLVREGVEGFRGDPCGVE